MNDADENGALPEGWTVTTIATVTDEVASRDPRRQPEGAFNYVDISSIDNERLVVAETKRLLAGEAPSRARRPLQSGDVVFSNVRTYLRNVARVDGVPHPAVASTGFTVLRPNEATVTDYLFRYVSSDEFLRLVTPRQTGTHYPATSDKVVRQQVIPLPPVAEQRRIAARLDEIDLRRAVAAAHLQAASAVVERFRGAVLAAACAGDLTDTWREENGHAGCNGEISAEWSSTTLQDLCSRITSGPRDWSGYYGRGRGTFVMAHNVRRGQLDWSGRQAVDPPPNDASRRRCQIERGDLLVTIVGANTGDVAPVLDERPEHYVCQSVALVRPTDHKIADFLNLWFNSPLHGRRYFDSCIYGAGRPHLSFEQLKSAPVSFPPITEQHEIVRRVGLMLAAAEDLTAQIHRIAATLDRAAKASVAKAFRGELLQPEAALAKEEGRDFESADELLGRIAPSR